MSDRPQLIGIVLCELVLQDVLRRDAISCVNIHSGVVAPDAASLDLRFRAIDRW
jgi:hypothetical protein